MLPTGLSLCKGVEALSSNSCSVHRLVITSYSREFAQFDTRGDDDTLLVGRGEFDAKA
jgi:hypothetical protein